MRSGYTLTLLPDPGADTFSFTADSNTPEQGFFPLATSTIFPCKANASSQLDCSNGGRTWPTHVKQDWNETYTPLKKIFSFTDEHHSFFQLHGTEIFSFTGVSNDFLQ